MKFKKEINDTNLVVFDNGEIHICFNVGNKVVFLNKDGMNIRDNDDIPYNRINEVYSTKERLDAFRLVAKGEYEKALRESKIVWKNMDKSVVLCKVELDENVGSRKYWFELPTGFSEQSKIQKVVVDTVYGFKLGTIVEIVKIECEQQFEDFLKKNGGVTFPMKKVVEIRVPIEADSF